jgi:hypothetical protein
VEEKIMLTTAEIWYKCDYPGCDCTNRSIDTQISVPIGWETLNGKHYCGKNCLLASIQGYTTVSSPQWTETDRGSWKLVAKHYLMVNAVGGTWYAYTGAGRSPLEATNLEDALKGAYEDQVTMLTTRLSNLTEGKASA